MDRSFLSQPEVITASRAFVCVRLTTYENKEEGDFLKSFKVTRSGDLENTVFTILAPDGEKQLARASRSARQTFGDATHMAETMNRIAGEYPARKSVDGELPPLPTVANLRLAIDVAACDNQPLVIVFAPDKEMRRQLEKKLSPLAWSERFLGQFIYVSVREARDVTGIENAKADAGILIVQPDSFGMKAKLLKQVPATASAEKLAECLKEGATLYRSEGKTFSSHVREGQRKGIYWDTLLPVTDPQERSARERGRSQNSQPK